MVVREQRKVIDVVYIWHDVHASGQHYPYHIPLFRSVRKLFHFPRPSGNMIYRPLPGLVRLLSIVANRARVNLPGAFEVFSRDPGQFVINQ